MSHFKVALFDVDGVTVLPQMLFSQFYAKKYNINLTELTPFYKTEDFLNALRGKESLENAIEKHQDKWHWEDDPKALITMWCEAENNPNTELIETIQSKRQEGLIAFLTANQEKNRTEYLRSVMFAGKFDGIFSSSEVGLLKAEPGFFEQVIEELQKRVKNLIPQDIVYFDDGQKEIDVANKAGIQAFLYENVNQVRNLL